MFELNPKHFLQVYFIPSISENQSKIYDVHGEIFTIFTVSETNLDNSRLSKTF